MASTNNSLSCKHCVVNGIGQQSSMWMWRTLTASWCVIEKEKRENEEKTKWASVCHHPLSWLTFWARQHHNPFYPLSQWKLKDCLEEHTRKRKRKVLCCCEGQGSEGRREHTGSAGSEAPSVPKMGGRDGNTNTSTATKRAWMPHHNPTHSQNTGGKLKRQSVE